MCYAVTVHTHVHTQENRPHTYTGGGSAAAAAAALLQLLRIVLLLLLLLLKPPAEYLPLFHTFILYSAFALFLFSFWFLCFLLFWGCASVGIYRHFCWLPLTDISIFVSLYNI